jgi:hypothetical protein
MKVYKTPLASSWTMMEPLDLLVSQLASKAPRKSDSLLHFTVTHWLRKGIPIRFKSFGDSTPNTENRKQATTDSAIATKPQAQLCVNSIKEAIDHPQERT